jgi:DNA-binding NarL/FixJ family response regulator
MLAPMPTISVLIVDDHALFGEALAARLKVEPDLAILPVAHEARRAAALMATERVDVVLLDFVLGATSGLEVLTILRRHDPNVRVLMLSALGELEPMVAAFRHGAVGWIPKTAPAELVVSVIRSAVNGGGWVPPEVLGDVLRELTMTAASPIRDVLRDLTPREQEVLQCMVDGLGRFEIATRLGLSANTIRTHTQNLLAKLGVHSVLEAITVAMRAGVHPAFDVADSHSDA